MAPAVSETEEQTGTGERLAQVLARIRETAEDCGHAAESRPSTR